MKQKLSLWSGIFFLLFVIGFVSYLGKLTWDKVTDARSLPISKLVLQGDVTYTREQDIKDAIFSIAPLGSVVTQDVDQLQNAILALPWVQSVAVRKQWPDTLKLFIVEHQAVAVWNKDKLLNKNGVIFDGSIDDVSEKHLIALFSNDEQSQFVLQAWREIALLFKNEALPVKELWYSVRHAWTLVLNNGIRLELGKEALIERVKRFLLLYPKLKEKQEQIVYFDLRYDTGVAVGWKEKAQEDIEKE